MTSAAINLNRHAVIEASAGTGKTYTIENLVLRILLETGTTLDHILLVTFTEKATGDLRLRLRQTLERNAHDHPERRPLLLRALDNFDQAPIFTIHGFCQRMLQEYALEQGEDFRPALVDDAELLPQALREVQRKVWRTEFGDRLRAVLEHAGFGRDSAAVWEDKVRTVAARYHPRSDHQLRPAPVANWWRRLDEPDARWFGQLEVFTVDAIRKHLVDYKRQRGLQSFDDMISIVEENLDPARNPDAPQLLNRLRDRYRFGIVDEFQDTDPLQWRIFRRIFLDAGTSKLFVVGDPKQAIFGFRGADLPTYIRARDEMRDQAGADFIPLQTNWRSAPDLLDALNCLFADGDWFPRHTRIDYRNVGPPDEQDRQAYVATDLTNRAAMTIVDLRASERLKEARRAYARFVAHEVRQLLAGSGGQPSLTFALKKADPRPLEASDICILVFSRNEAEPITDALTDLGIPYSFQRRRNFWLCDEVAELETALVCLSRPEERSSFRKALLTCLFRMRPAELVQCLDLPLSHPARRLWQRWLAYAEARQWSALFQSMIEETGLLLLALEDDAAAQRLEALQHAMDVLQRVGHGENRDLFGLIDWIRTRRRQREPSDNEQPPAEASRARVRIMTIHASKGLEFPVVFLAGGFTSGRAPGPVATYRDEHERRVFDFCPDGAARGRMAEEAMSEQRRLLYVALTRPMFKLYVPMIHLGSRARSWVGSAGTVLLPALKQACPDKLGPLIAGIVTPARLAEFGANAEPDRAALREARPALHCRGALFPPLDPNLHRRRILVRSFSSMSRQHIAAVGQAHSYGDRIRIVRDEGAAAEEPDDPLRGPAFGEMVHRALETIDYAEVGHCTRPAELLLEGTPARRVIEQAVHANVANLHGKSRAELEVAAREQVAHLVWTALRTPLIEAGGCLADIPRTDRLHELEFQFAEHPGEQRREEGFVTGYMDLVFRRRDRFFLVDFKTNLLAAYTPEQLAQAMEEADYHRQYRLYLHALCRWLQRVRTERPALEQLGGVYYLFLRGLNGRDESAGVFFHRPTAADIDLALAITS